MARAQLVLGDAEAAAKALAAVQLGLAGLGEGGLRYLAGSQEVFGDVFALLHRSPVSLGLHFLGSADVRHGGRKMKLRKRFKLELWEATLEALPENDPRWALTLARVKRLREDWGV